MNRVQVIEEVIRLRDEKKRDLDEKIAQMLMDEKRPPNLHWLFLESKLI